MPLINGGTRTFVPYSTFLTPPLAIIPFWSTCMCSRYSQCRFTTVNILNAKKSFMYNWKRRTDEQTAIIPMARWIFMSAIRGERNLQSSHKMGDEWIFLKTAPVSSIKNEPFFSQIYLAGQYL
jgi:hypothetical protein